jgi:hypothetical protein
MNDTPRPLAALRMAFPNYRFTVIVTGDLKRRFEAVAKDGSQPWCLISSDPAEIWSELRAAHPDA